MNVSGCVIVIHCFHIAPVLGYRYGTVGTTHLADNCLTSEFWKS